MQADHATSKSTTQNEDTGEVPCTDVDEGQHSQHVDKRPATITPTCDFLVSHTALTTAPFSPTCRRLCIGHDNIWHSLDHRMLCCFSEHNPGTIGKCRATFRHRTELNRIKKRFVRGRCIYIRVYCAHNCARI